MPSQRLETNEPIMAWTKERPTQPGWYWAYEKLDQRTADVMMVEVFVAQASEELWGRAMSLRWELSHFSHWMGPLEPPEPPRLGQGGKRG